MDQTLELANFRGNDEPCLVEAALACRACLSSDVEWSLLVDDFEGQVRVPLPRRATTGGWSRSPPSRRSGCRSSRPDPLSPVETSGMSEAGSFPRTDALDVIVELISELDERPRPGGRGFYDRLCEALCRQASMRRAGLMLYDEARRLVVPVGSHGLEAELLAGVYGSLEETPIAQMALSEDRVVQVSDHLERWVPARYADFAQLTTLTCTPVSAGGRWLGVIFADRGGEPFELNDDERSAMWTIGKTAALAASVRIATNQQGRARLLQARIDLAREIHEGVVQRLFGVSLALGVGARAERRDAPPLRRRDAGGAGRPARRARAAARARAAVDTGVTLRGELDRLGGRYKDMPLELELAGRAWRCRRSSSRSPSRCWPRRSATPTSTPLPPGATMKVGLIDGTFVLEVRNDGARRRARAAPGMGLRLAAVEALQVGRRRGVRARAARALARAPRGAREGRRRDEPGAQPARARGGRPRRGALGLPAAAHRAALGGALPDRHERGGGARRWRAATSRTWRSWTCSSARPPGAELCEAIRRESPSTRVLLISGAGWISPQAARAAGASGFVSKDSPARRRGQGRARGGPRADRVRRPRRAAVGPAVRARARGARADGVRARRTRRSPTCCSSRRTRSRSTRARSTASCACATAPRPCGAPSGSGSGG